MRNRVGEPADFHEGAPKIRLTVGDVGRLANTHFTPLDIREGRTVRE